MFIFKAVVDRLDDTAETVELCIDSCVAAGYTGRNRESVEAHIDELRKLDVPVPYSIPAMYWISPSRLTSHDQILVVGDKTSPEAEFFLARDRAGTLYVTVASDHTDRQLEAVSVGKSKQVCDKILGDIFWKVEDVAGHWDDIQLSSRVLDGDGWKAYQSGSLGDIMHYGDLLELLRTEDPAGAAPALLSGTIPVAGGEAVYTSCCEITLADPVLHRAIVKKYNITVMPDRS
jgi:hypothetical protein